MIGDVIVRVVRSDGKKFIIGDGKWRIPNDGLENWANLNYNVSSAELPSYDGSVITSSRVASQDRSIRAVVGDPKNNAELRAEAIAFFNPKYDFEAHLKYQGRTRYCKGKQIGFRCSEGNIYKPAEINWTIFCPNPYLLSESDFGKDIAAVLPMLGFPFMSFLPTSQGSAEGCNVGFVASHRSFQQYVTLENDGDVQSGMKFIIRANGDVINPVVRINDTFVRAIVDMHQGDRLDVDLSIRPPKVYFNGENAMQLIDRQSTLLSMYIQPGETVVEYDADDGYQNMSVSIYYNKQYLGI